MFAVSFIAVLLYLFFSVLFAMLTQLPLLGQLSCGPMVATTAVDL